MNREVKIKTILLSIKPEFVEKIQSGEKRFEYRKKLPKQKFTRVIIYASRPIQRIIGEFQVGAIYSESPEKLWRLTSNHSGIDKTFFDAYFHGCEIAHAIRINDFHAYPEPRLLPHGIMAPQSFRYI